MRWRSFTLLRHNFSPCRSISGAEKEGAERGVLPEQGGVSAEEEGARHAKEERGVRVVDMQVGGMLGLEAVKTGLVVRDDRLLPAHSLRILHLYKLRNLHSGATFRHTMHPFAIST